MQRRRKALEGFQSKRWELSAGESALTGRGREESLRPAHGSVMTEHTGFAMPVPSRQVVGGCGWASEAVPTQ